jgi:hypothetical protein
MIDFSQAHPFRSTPSPPKPSPFEGERFKSDSRVLARGEHGFSPPLQGEDRLGMGLRPLAQPSKYLLNLQPKCNSAVQCEMHASWSTGGGTAQIEAGGNR